MAKQSLPPGLEDHYGKIRVRYGRHGFKKVLDLSPYNQKDIKAALKYLDHVKSRIRLGLSPEPNEDEGKLTGFAAAAQEFLDVSKAAVKESTWKDYDRILRRYWIPEFKGMPLEEIDARRVRLALSRMTVADKAKKNALVPLSGIFRHFGFNPNPAAAKGSFKRRQKPKVDRYTLRERDSLINAMSGMAQAYHVLLFACGLRPGEALGLKKKDYDGEQFEVSRQITDGRLELELKNYARRIVFVPTWARPFIEAVLEDRQDDDYILLNQESGPFYDRHALYDAWRKAHEDTGIPYRDAYKCRHTRAAELLSLGVSYGEAAEQLGHSPEMFLRIYAEFKREYSGKRDLSHLEGATVKAKVNVAPKPLRLVVNNE